MRAPLTYPGAGTSVLTHWQTGIRDLRVLDDLRIDDSAAATRLTLSVATVGLSTLFHALIEASQSHPIRTSALHLLSSNTRAAVAPRNARRSGPSCRITRPVLGQPTGVRARSP